MSSSRLEYECNQLDLHDRYISSESWSEKFGFTNIPVVDHWTDYLMRVLSLIINKKIKPSKKYSLHISILLMYLFMIQVIDKEIL